MSEIHFQKQHVARLKKLKILAVYLFGSQAEGNIHPLSDVDIGVVFERPEEYNTLFDLAAISHIPTDLLSDERVTEKLPVFFRTIRGEKPSREELEELIRIMKEE